MGKRLNELGESKYFANRGLERNKTPLANKQYKFEIIPLKEGIDEAKYEQYKFKDQGFLTMSWANGKVQKNGDFNWFWHGFITTNDLKKILGEKQYGKFCQGKREFTIQRRIDGKNVPLDKKK